MCAFGPNGDHRVYQHHKIRPNADVVRVLSITTLSKWVPAVEAKCPPAEKPIIPMRLGSTPHPAAPLPYDLDGALRILQGPDSFINHDLIRMATGISPETP
jgi:hypothetical protein